MIHAKSGDNYFLQQLAETEFTGTVHSVFRHALNIRSTANDEIFTLATKAMDNAPNSLVIDLDTLDNLHIIQNDPVRIKHHQLLIEDKLTIALETATHWQCHLPIFPSDMATLKQNIVQVKQFIDIYGKSGGMKRSDSPVSAFEAETSRLLKERTALLHEELCNRRFNNFQQYVLDLVGLGPGLTPSGDDFIVGLLTIIHLEQSPCSIYQPLCESVIKWMKPLTNEISYTTLNKAAYGQVRESIHALVSAMLSGTEGEAIEALKKVLAIGSSSGTDIALGLISGFEANIKLGG
ncbi:DUF2877 domain-containing protein [Lysinibacillus fusiformis]|uniref:DUF2877 domain-containing protein n=1 Tax=Lysinibacillus fusiformis TaxID=28031 RepID=UPI001E5EE259|nr:DUF2877 domain-containing protein [Lysinibacillus fusiformis]MCE4043207.1 DUF2877 domain-containing protein [Lysinibacillus fusiformis]